MAALQLPLQPSPITPLQQILQLAKLLAIGGEGCQQGITIAASHQGAQLRVAPPHPRGVGKSTRSQLAQQVRRGHA